MARSNPPSSNIATKQSNVNTWSSKHNNVIPFVAARPPTGNSVSFQTPAKSKDTITRHRGKMRTTRRTIRCMLLEIPPELRNRIYELVFWQNQQSRVDHVVKIDSNYRIPPILKTCRQIYHEAIGLYYSSTTFKHTRTFDEGNVFRSEIHDWLRNLPPQYRTAILKVQYTIQDGIDEFFEDEDLSLDEPATATDLNETILGDQLDWCLWEAKNRMPELRFEQIEVPWMELGDIVWSWKNVAEIEARGEKRVTRGDRGRMALSSCETM